MKGDNEQYNLFESFNYLSIRVRSLGGIVQNEGVEHSSEELREWNDIANSVIYSLNQLKENTFQFVNEKIQE